jgi:ABC-type nitrate/sulfonate/bicarbonate transport system permease component
MPYVISGMKLAVASGIVGVVLGSAEGLGYVMLSVQGVRDTAGMFMR